MSIEILTLRRLHEMYIVHRSSCALCHSDGPTLCMKGMEITKEFHRKLYFENSNVMTGFKQLAPMQVRDFT